MVLTVSFVLSSATGLVCHRCLRIISANLTPASGRQDHTTSPSASAPFVKGAARVHRIPPRIRDDRETPLGLGRDHLALFLFLANGKAENFSRGGWTQQWPDSPTGKSHRTDFPNGAALPLRHGRACPGHPRASRCEDVDARHKPGHDVPTFNGLRKTHRPINRSAKYAIVLR